MRAIGFCLAWVIAWPEIGLAQWRDVESIRGITVGPIECPAKPACGYGSPASEKALDAFVQMGANWIALTPFGRVWNLQSTHIKLDFEASFEENKRDVIAMVEKAHARGLKVMIIPHIFVQSSGLKGDEAGGWRGEFNMQSKERWARYQAEYKHFVMTWARVAADAHADAFSIGAECVSWSGRFGGYWTALIRSVRGIFPGLLTYSANWYGEVHHVPFWDQLDFIGINAFFDLASHDNATDKEYAESAQRHAKDIAELAAIVKKPVVFMELGFTSRPNGAVKPWKWPENVTSSAIDEHEQVRGFTAMADAFIPNEWFRGFFVWRYPADFLDLQEPRWGFSPLEKEADATVVSIFKARWAADILSSNQFGGGLLFYREFGGHRGQRPWGVPLFEQENRRPPPN